LTVWRKGSVTFHIDVTGRAAHAGVAPQLGRNAAVELIHQIQASHWPTSGPGLTSNLTIVNGGSRNNIIPEHASAQFNVRYRDKADMARVEEDFRKNATTTLIPDTKVAISSDPAFPHMRSALSARAFTALALSPPITCSSRSIDSGSTWSGMRARSAARVPWSARCESGQMVRERGNDCIRHRSPPPDHDGPEPGDKPMPGQQMRHPSDDRPN